MSQAGALLRRAKNLRSKFVTQLVAPRRGATSCAYRRAPEGRTSIHVSAAPFRAQHLRARYTRSRRERV